MRICREKNERDEIVVRMLEAAEHAEDEDDDKYDLNMSSRKFFSPNQNDEVQLQAVERILVQSPDECEQAEGQLDKVQGEHDAEGLLQLQILLLA